MKRFWMALALAAAVTVPAAAMPHQTVTRPADLAMAPVGPENFTGTVTTAPVYTAQEPSKSYGAVVTFAPGARTYWHVHAMGQTLLVTAGEGYTQEWGGEPVRLHAGDIVRCPPGVKHWHGAAPDSAMTHVALSETGGVTWLEPVGDDTYPDA